MDPTQKKQPIEKELPTEQIQVPTTRITQKTTHQLVLKKEVPTTRKKRSIKKLRVSTTRIDKKTTYQLRPKKELQVPTKRKKLFVEKVSNPGQTPVLKSLQIPQKSLNKEESKLLRTDLENIEKHILSLLKIDKDRFSQYMQDIYALLCQNFSTHNEAIEYFKKHIHKEIIDKLINGDL